MFRRGVCGEVSPADALPQVPSWEAPEGSHFLQRDLATERRGVPADGEAGSSPDVRDCDFWRRELTSVAPPSSSPAAPVLSDPPWLDAFVPGLTRGASHPLRDGADRTTCAATWPTRARYVGDVRDFNSVGRASQRGGLCLPRRCPQAGAVAILPQRAVATNVHGTDNVIRAASANGVKTVVCLSTDKTVLPHQRHGHVQGVDGRRLRRPTPAITPVRPRWSPPLATATSCTRVGR